MSTFRNRPTSTENYRNPDHQKYVTGDGWKSGESDTDAPGAKSAKGAGKEGVAGLKAETARPPSHGNTGTQSAPEQKTKLGISVVTCKPNAGSMGQIKGGDPHGYLGHFRSPKVLKEGHNQGPPMAGGGAGDMPPPTGGAMGGGPMNVSQGPKAPGTAPVARPQYNAALNPVLGTRQAEKAAGTFGTPAGRAGMAAARQASFAIPAGQRRATAEAAQSAARQQNVAARQSAGAARRTAVSEAKSGLQSAIGGVKSARQGLREAIKGGNVSGAESAFGALKAARGERREARQGLRKARRG